MKSIQHPLVGKLHLLSVLETWWDTLSIDFVVELPELTGYDAVMMVVNLVLKKSILYSNAHNGDHRRSG